MVRLDHRLISAAEKCVNETNSCRMEELILAYRRALDLPSELELRTYVIEQQTLQLQLRAATAIRRADAAIKKISG